MLLVSSSWLRKEGSRIPVEVEEEHDEVETKLGEGFLIALVYAMPIDRSYAYPLVHIQLAEDLSRIQEMRVAHDPAPVLVPDPNSSVPQ